MTEKILLNVPLNRVEGDLEIRVELEEGRVTDAWSSGTMYRGFERMMIGRGALDGLVITPRVCGICGTSHLTTAAQALEALAGVKPPPNAIRLRNLALMVEHIQNNLRQSFLMFTTDFTNPAYRNNPLFDEAVRRYEAFKGESVLEVIKSTKRLLESVAIIGGQWPHSSYMVPGGLASIPSTSDLLQCRLILGEFRNWFERRILGCPLERWLEIRSIADVEQWLEERDSHRDSDLGFFLRFSREIGLEALGQGYRNFLSYGAFELPSNTTVQSFERLTDSSQPHSPFLVPAGFVHDEHFEVFDQQHIAEHVAHSWFIDYEGGKHPFDGKTHPYASGHESGKYSWAKAPRYKKLPAETGPLAQMIVARHPLFMELVQQAGSNAFSRQFARIARVVDFMPAMQTWLEESTVDKGRFYHSPGTISDGTGFGLTEGPRGALGHWLKLKDGKIELYQIITPTTWNASPRDSDDSRGPWEEALVGTMVQELENPVELGHVVRSFDACLVCTVHALTQGRKRRSLTLG